MWGDEQEPDMRCGIPGTSGHPPSPVGLRRAGSDCEVLHPQRGMLYKSGVYASKATCLTPGGLSGDQTGLPYAYASRLRLIARLKGEQSTLIVWQESAEGIVGVSTDEAI